MSADYRGPTNEELDEEILRREHGSEAPAAEADVTVRDFFAYMPTHSYIFTPSREMWPGASVNARVGPVKDGDKTLSASAWLDQNKPVEQMTWAPGYPMLIRHRLIADGGWIERQGVSCFNLYRPPTIILGVATKAGRWVDHAHKVFDKDANHIIMWAAHRVQRPQEKINHGLVLGGKPGIGKDSLLEPLKQAVGPWNFGETSPSTMLGRFNGFLTNVILRVNEARDLGEFDRFALYDHMKAFTAAPPDTLRVDEKHLREHYVFNCVGTIITTNHKTDGIYLPPDDRRHFVAWSELTEKDFSASYWNTLWRWYGEGGFGHVAAYLAELDLSAFDPKAPPPKTQAFWEIVDANRSPEDAELADVIDRMNNPDILTLSRIVTMADAELGTWLRDRKNRRLIPHRLERCEYVPVRNEGADDGLWKLGERRQVVYAKSALSVRERQQMANKFFAQSRAAEGDGGRWNQ
jgi:Family of unknown function (DUF5906)